MDNTALESMGGAHIEEPIRKFSSQHMGFYSILFETADDRPAIVASEQPHFFADLNCDQIVAAITAGRDEYNLAPFFHACLRRPEAIYYRHEIMRDLQDAEMRGRVIALAHALHNVRDHLASVRKLHYPEQRQAWFLDAVAMYCRSVETFARDLLRLEPNSRGLHGFRDYLTTYISSPRFTALLSEAQVLKSALSVVDYCVHIRTGGFSVRRFEQEADYSADVEATFAKFKQNAVRDCRVAFTPSPDMNHIEAKILEFVAKLNPGLFASLERFCTNHADFIDDTVATFDREVQFYIAYLQHIEPMQRAGLAFSYPRISGRSKQIRSRGGFDIALAHKLVAGGTPVICNDFHLDGDDRILVVSGPNQSGKTTFARAFGQLHYLACIGCPIPGTDAQLFLFDRIFTHFEREEKVDNLRGKLEDDLVRIRNILNQATAQSIIILNEVFTSTTIQDEVFLGKAVMNR